MTAPIPIEWKFDPHGGIGSLLGLSDELASLKAARAKVQAGLAALDTAKQTLEVLQTILQSVGDIGLVTLLRPVFDNLQQRIRDLRKTGIYALPIGFRPPDLRGPIKADQSAAISGLPGGTVRLKSFLRQALLDPRDPFRPAFSPEAGVMGVLLVGIGPDLTAINRIREVIERVLFSNDYGKALARLDRWQTSLGEHGLENAFQDAFAANRIAETVAPLGQTPWVSLTLEDVLPQIVSDTLLTFESALAGIIALLSKLNPLQRIIEQVQRVLADITTVLAFIDEVLRYLDILLITFPVMVGLFGPTVGGAQGLSNSLEDWFDQEAHPALQNVAPNALTIGVMLLTGSATLADLESRQTIINGFMKFGRDLNAL